MSEAELAWAAGFFDGEGYIGCVKHSRYKGMTYMRLSCTIAQIDRRVLDRFQAAVGVGIVRGPYTNGKTTSFQYSTGSTKAIWQVWTLLKPYLSPVKSEQFEAALAAMEAYRRGAHDRRVENGYKAAAKRWGFQREGVVV